ncbi:hypothetical protein CSKR_106668 [Clonorchis sinensis]|uniref:Uncharacterized protein n=1 Tax=Clonorchis sinensis TaxID=79923 RepID=A0A419Q103_CLOSI|nr:hypothetical protein CSKR_106668 [Clonorchis sinensis]
MHSFANKFGFSRDSPGTQLNFSVQVFASSWIAHQQEYFVWKWQLFIFQACGIGILVIFTPLSFERSSSCSGSSSAVHIQWPYRDLNPGHLTCEASVLPLLHQRTLDASEFSRLNRRNVFTLERCAFFFGLFPTIANHQQKIKDLPL